MVCRRDGGVAAHLAVLALSGRGGETEDELVASVRPVAILQGLLAFVAMACLVAVFVASDMSVKLVVENSHSAKPLIYKFAGTWGNHEGSMLLWVTILGLAGGAVAIVERRLPPRTLVATLGAQATIALGFYAFLLLASNPFARLWPAPADGQGLNPLLQDPAWRSIRRRSTSAMSGCRSPSPSRSVRWSRAMWGLRSRARCGHGCSGRGSS